MKVTVELPEEEMLEICDLSGTQKKGPAIRILLDDALQLRRRAKISQKFLTGEWSAELNGYEAAKAADTQSARTLAEHGATDRNLPLDRFHPGQNAPRAQARDSAVHSLARRLPLRAGGLRGVAPRHRAAAPELLGTLGYRSLAWYEGVLKRFRGFQHDRTFNYNGILKI